MDFPLNRTWLQVFLSTGYPVTRYPAYSSKFLFQLCEFSIVCNYVANTHRFIPSNDLNQPSRWCLIIHALCKAMP